MLSINDINGINLEHTVSWTLEHKFKIPVEHNDFTEEAYPLDNHNIVDIATPDSLIECTNPKETTWMNDEVMAKKLQYFIRKDPLHSLFWTLIVSFANWSQAIMELINRMGIRLITLGVHANHKLDWRIVHSLLKFAQILCVSKHKSVSTNINISTISTTNSTPLMTNTHLHLHCTPNKIVLVSGRVDSDYDDYCLGYGYVLCWNG